MPIQSKDFHVVTYFKPADKGEPRRVLRHGEVQADESIEVDPSGNGRIHNDQGRLKLRLSYDVFDLSTGKRSIPMDDGTLVIEARRIVSEKGKVVEPRKLSALGVRMLDAQLDKEQRQQELRDEVHNERGALDELRERFLQNADIGAVPAVVKRLMPRTARAWEENVARWRAKVEGPLDARLAEADQLLASERITDAQVQRLCDRRERLAGALEEHAQVLEALQYAMGQLEREVSSRALSSAGRRGKLLAEVDGELATAFGQIGRNHGIDDELYAASTRLAALDSPGFDVVGSVAVTPQIGKAGAVLGWTVRFENQGRQPFSGTVVFSDGQKNGGIGLESMALPQKGAAAEQTLMVGGDYGGVRALPGERIRLGVRSFGWIEVALPKSGAIKLDVQDFHVENDGQNRPEDWSAPHLEHKRAEKFALGKVRFFVNDKPWWPK